MINRDIRNNIESNIIYKRVGSNNSNLIPKTLLNAREKYETKLSMALLNPNENRIKIEKFQRILNKLEDTIDARIFGVSLHE
jgi:hypothetical protein